ncbi:hypothetical protein DENSPDRAFT_198963 [Dentipellis sp. KUC8613]|nr:hypothetical protein DENSPDRAFT_198963 [Dentipellis sp. KUC8613]
MHLRRALKSVFRRSTSGPHIPGGPASVVQSGPISRLPPELLGIIFMHVLDDDAAFVVPERGCLQYRSPWQEKMRAPVWTDILFVCRYWRGLAYNLRNLWTRIESSSNPWMRYCMDMSGGLPLRVKFSEATLTMQENMHDLGTHPLFVIADISSHVHHIRELSMVASCDFDTSSLVLTFCLNKAAPELEVLTLDQEGALNTPGQYNDILKEIFNPRDTPKLRKICARAPSLGFRMQATIFRGLTYLDISYQYLWRAERMEYLIVCMESWTELRTLILKWSLPRDLDPMAWREVAYSPPWRTIHLPHLEQLNVTDVVTYADYFLHHLVLPPLLTLTLECASDLAKVGDPQIAIAAFSSILQRIPLETTSRIARVHWNCQANDFSLRGYMGGPATECANPSEDFPSDFTIHMWTLQPHDYADTGLTEAIWNSLYLPNLTWLWLTLHDDLYRSSWGSILGPMKELHALKVDGPYERSMVELFFALGFHEIGGAMCPILPRLQGLHLRQPFISAVTWEYLLDTLRARWSSGAPELTLRVRTNKASSAHIEGSLGYELENFTYVFDLDDDLEDPML